VDNGNVVGNSSNAAQSLAANISGSGSLTISGVGTISLTGSNTYTGGTTINAGTLIIGAESALPAGESVLNNSSLVVDAGTASAPVTVGPISGDGSLIVNGYLQLSGSAVLSQQSALTISSGAALDIGADTFILNYGTSADPIANVVAELTNGRNGGSWNGTGILSSAVAAANAGGAAVYGVGYADGADGIISALSSGEIVIAPALLGDAKLAGTVTFGDFQILSQNFGSPGAWDMGNWTYGSTIAFGDFQELAINFGKASQFTIDLGSAPADTHAAVIVSASTPATPTLSSPAAATTKTSADHPAVASLSLFGDQSILAPAIIDEILGEIVQTNIHL